MKTSWYLVKVLPGKERQLTDEFNRQIELGKLKNIKRFVCPTEKVVVNVKNKKVVREKVLYSGYLYFESFDNLNEDQLKTISLTPNIMSMGKDKLPIQLRDSDISRVLVDDNLTRHIDSKLTKYVIDEMVTIIDGPFSTFEGKITQIKPDDTVEVTFMIFGRPNKIDLKLNQIKKI